MDTTASLAILANSCFQSLMQTLPHLDNAVTLNIGNALFANRSVPLKEPFRQVTAQYYEAEAENLDFTRTKESADIINAWCKQKTNGLIPKMLDETNPEAIVYLLNAVYFNGKWKKPFTPSQTKSKTFTNESGTRCEVPMMIQTASFRYGETAGMQCLCLPFGKGSYNMYILLPKHGVTLSGLMKGLNAESWNTFKGKLLEIGDGQTVGMLVVDTQSSAYVDMLHMNTMTLQLILQLVHAIAESLEVTHIEDL